MPAKFMASMGVAACACIGSVHAGPVVHLRFDNASSLGADSSGNGNHAAVIGSVGYDAGGITGGSLDLRNTAAVLRWTGEANPVEDLLDGDFTFSLWINTTQVFGSDASWAFQGAGIVYADVSGSPSGPELDCTPLALAGSRLTGLAGNDGIGDLRSTSVVNTGQWVHVVVRRTVGVTFDLFVNGVMESSVPTINHADLSALDALVLGGNTLDNRYFDGRIDEFQGYEGALSDEQVLFLFNNPGAAATCAADYNGEGDEGDILDFLDFMDDFGSCFGEPLPCGSFGTVDLNGDTVVDVLDFLDFLDAFGRGC
ncbi:MAG: LamG domain-containing protein [Phycisphaeraceae bacterium]|nr:LamG domain-containing protein [Phycisphaeraceae bacterium]